MTTDHGLRTTDYRRGLHWWAVLTVCATVVLLGLGSAVTTFKAGMADPDWPTMPTALAQASAEQLQDVRFVIEHSHRLAGYVVGCLSIGLAVWPWLREPRRWVCWLGVAALVGVCIQGVVGGLRVLEHARWGLELRVLHGCFAQIVLALLVSVAVCTSRAWLAPATGSSAEASRLRRLALTALGLVYLQIVFGVLLRHMYFSLWQRLHLLTAFAATAAVVWLVKTAFDTRSGGRPLRVAAGALAGVVALQLMLGVEAWMMQLAAGTLPELLPLTTGRVAVRTAHVLGGSLVFALTVVVALLAGRRLAPLAQAVPGGRLEEAA